MTPLRLADTSVTDLSLHLRFVSASAFHPLIRHPYPRFILIHMLMEFIVRSSFVVCFWTGTNGNKLTEALNCNNRLSRGSKIRRVHECWPHMYCVVSKNDLRREWKYCKVGITEKNTTTGVSNRMKTVRKEIMKTSDTRQNLGRFKNAGIVFVLPVKATDSRPNNEIEKSVREHIGWPVDKDLARQIGLPFG